MNPAADGFWSSGLFDCSGDCGLCCMMCWCPWIAFGRIAEIVDKGETSCLKSGALYAVLSSLTGFQWIYSFTYRTKMRQQYALPEAPCSDCLVHFCCERRALRQEYRELQARGFDPAIGWQFNVERGIGKAPGMVQMAR